MPITKEMIARNADCSAIVGLIDQGSLYSTGHLSIYQSDGSRITWNALSIPAFGTSVDGTSTAYPISDATNVLGYDTTANNFSFDNRDGTAIWRGDVSLNGYGGSLQLESLIVPKDSTIGITSALYIVRA